MRFSIWKAYQLAGCKFKARNADEISGRDRSWAMVSDQAASEAQREQYLQLINPVAVQTYVVEETLVLLKTISGHADAINGRNFDKFFVPIQTALIDSLMLALAKLFETENARYQLDSIPALIARLEQHEDEFLPIAEDRWARVREEVCMSYCSEALAGNETTIKSVLSRLRAMIDRSGDLAAAYNEARDALKTHRDKRLAHAERVSPADLPSVTMDHIDQLRDFARCAVAVLSYFITGDSHIVNGNEYTATNQAETARVCLERLLMDARIIDDKDTSA
jgi:AbiU2